MINTLIGQKVNQAQSFLQNGLRIPVTEITVTENVVLQVKTADKDAYSAVQLGAGLKKKPIKALLGHVKKSGVDKAPFKIKEVRVDNVSEDLPGAGDSIALDSVFKPGDIVQVTGTSKGKGFAGVVRRYNFRGGPKTHGQSDRHRAPGSIGQGTTPGRVYKGKRMAGRMGSDTVTVKNLTVVDVDAENKKLYVSGLIPGHRNSWVYITRIGEDKKFVPLISDKEEVAEEVIADEAPVEEIKVEKTEEIKAEESPVEEVKDAAETQSSPVATAGEAVTTTEESVKTATETVEVAGDTVEAPAEVASNAIEEENKKDAKSDLADSEKEENA